MPEQAQQTAGAWLKCGTTTVQRAMHQSNSIPLQALSQVQQQLPWHRTAAHVQPPAELDAQLLPLRTPCERRALITWRLPCLLHCSCGICAAAGWARHTWLRIFAAQLFPVAFWCTYLCSMVLLFPSLCYWCLQFACQ